MEFKTHKIKKGDILRGPDHKAIKWFKRRLVLGRYSYSVKNLFYTLFAIAIVIISAIYLTTSYQIYRSDPNIAIEKETRSLTLRIGRFMELPKDEQPSLATVTDKAKLKGQEFFSHAQNGDKLLVYAKAKKAILYRPSIEKIIDVTNLTSGSQNTCGQTPQPNP